MGENSLVPLILFLLNSFLSQKENLITEDPSWRTRGYPKTEKEKRRKRKGNRISIEDSCPNIIK